MANCPFLAVAIILGLVLSVFGHDGLTLGSSSLSTSNTSVHINPDSSTVFRLGNGAGPPLPRPSSTNYIDKQAPMRTRLSPYVLCMAILALFVLSMPTYMMPGHGHGSGPPALSGRDFSYRIPPYWSPAQETTYSFRPWMADIFLWIMLTDVQAHQQRAAITMRCGGTAQAMTCMMTPEEMAMCGQRDGQQLDPVTYLLGALRRRFAALEEATRLTSMTEMLAFQRRPGENINSLLARYATVRQRAPVEGQFAMSIEGCSLQLLRAVGMQPQFLHPFNGRLPQTDGLCLHT
jgi:hypothetical protein